MMNEDASISIKSNTELTIFIKNSKNNLPVATIISNSGETIQKINLNAGKNSIDITPYLYKNYAIRVVNGKNITVQKI